MIHFAVLGTGKIADGYLVPALREVPGARLWSVLSRDLGRVRAFADKHRAASPSPAHTDLSTLLADPDLHAVIVATPDKLHAEQAIMAARAGKHVFVEKPMVTDVAAGRTLVEACRRAGVRLGVGYHLRWHAGHRDLVAQIHRGALGALHHMRVLFSRKLPDASNWRASTNVGRWWGLAGYGTHGVDFIRWAMLPSCGEITEVKSMIARDFWKGPHDETALVMFRFESGATAELVTSILFNSTSSIDVYGREGSAHCVGTLGYEGRGEVILKGQPLAFTPVNPYVGELADFVGAVLEKRDPEVAGGEGLRNVELLIQADPAE